MRQNPPLFKVLICAKSISVIWKNKNSTLLALSLSVSVSLLVSLRTYTLHIFHQHIHQCPAVIWGMWCAISLWRHCHRTAYFTSPPDAGLSRLWQGFFSSRQRAELPKPGCLIRSKTTEATEENGEAMKISWSHRFFIIIIIIYLYHKGTIHS